MIEILEALLAALPGILLGWGSHQARGSHDDQVEDRRSDGEKRQRQQRAAPMRGTWQSASADGGRESRYPVVMETDRDRLNDSPALPLDKVESEADHFYVCQGCGQAVDMRLLGDVLHHEQPGHEPLPKQ